MNPVSPAAASLWAKYDKARDSSMPLHVHMSDSAGVALRVWDDWVPAFVRRDLAAAVGNEDSARRMLSWLAAVHDLGKATPAFAIQVPTLTDAIAWNQLAFPTNLQGREVLPHSLGSQILLERWLLGRGWDAGIARSYAIVPGGHHGVPPTTTALNAARDRSRWLGDTGAWRAAQDELAEFAAELADVPDLLDRWSQRHLPKTAQVTLTALVIVADWLASDAELFPYGADAVGLDATSRVADAWVRLQLPSPWHAVPLDPDDEILHARFDLPRDARLRPVQRAALDMLNGNPAARLLIIEAPMGVGKTETALLAAEDLAARNGSGGVAFALPSMATTDAIFTRLESWVSRLPDARGAGRRQTTFLAHGKARLNEVFRRVAVLRRLMSVSDEASGSDVVVVHEWLRGRKRGALANFVAATIDQILFSALKTRHVVLRHLALTGKVVVIDEVHASDHYMGVYLRRALSWLGAHGTPVILLSATLPPEARAALVTAYLGGDGPPATTPASGSFLARPRRTTGETTIAAPPRRPAWAADRRYPLLTAATPAGEITTRHVPGEGETTAVRLESFPDDLESLVARLRTDLSEGGSVAVIRNTVRRAQETFTALRDALPSADVVLVHSRFLAVDRMAIETRLRSVLGPSGGAGELVRFGGRPLIVVGTQVLEQSLDIDADLMVSDLAPADLLLQRMGRLHRHERANRAPSLREPRMLITGLESWEATPPRPESGTLAVYTAYPLLRTLAVLREPLEAGTAIRLPEDIAPLVAETFEPSAPPPPGWESAVADAESLWRARIADKEARAATFLLPRPDDEKPTLVGWLEAGVGNLDEDSAQGQAQVRDAEESLEVLVVRRVDSEIRLLPWVRDGAVVPTDSRPDPESAYAVAESSVRLPSTLSRPWMAARVIGALEQNGFPGWQQSEVLRGQLVLVLDEELRAEVAGETLRYDRDLGLVQGPKGGNT